MRLKRFIREGWAAGKIGAILAALLGVCFLLMPIGQGLKHWSYDLPIAMRSTVPVEEAVVVYLDDISHTALQQPYDAAWNRGLHARLVNRLKDCGARAIAFDILFLDEGPDRSADAAFAQAIRDHGSVVLAADLGSSDYFSVLRQARLTLPYSNFVMAIPNWGLAVPKIDADEAVREHFHGWPDMPSLSWRLAVLLGCEVTRSPANQERLRWLNYYGPSRTLPTLSFSRALDSPDAVLTNFFRGKVVFVGAGGTAGFAGTRRDQFRNPFMWSGEARSPGVDIHATMFLNLLRGDWLKRLPPVVELLMVVVLGLTAGCGLALLPPKRAAVVSLAAIFAIGAAGVLSAWLLQVWFSWLVPCLIQIPAAAVCSMMFATQRAVEAARWGETREFTPASATASHGQPPRIPDHELFRRIGRGSYGEVWLGRNVMGTWRAIKIVRREAGGRRFEREFAGLKKFEPISRAHEGLVDILHVGRDDSAGYFFYVMELADDAQAARNDGVLESWSSGSGLPPQNSSTPLLQNPGAYVPRTLRHETLGPALLPINECLQIGLALTGALDFLHQQGLIHRDIKPSNIVFVGGLPKLADIGLVTEVGEAQSFVGTEGYIPPEGPGTPQADLFSLGRVLYEVATGMDCRQFPQLPPKDDRPERERFLRLYDVIFKAGEGDACRRYATAREMQADLLRLLGGG